MSSAAHQHPQTGHPRLGGDTCVPLPGGLVHGEGSLRLQSSAGGRAVVLQAGHHPQRRQAGRGLVRVVQCPGQHHGGQGRWVFLRVFLRWVLTTFFSVPPPPSFLLRLLPDIACGVNTPCPPRICPLALILSPLAGGGGTTGARSSCGSRPTTWRRLSARRRRSRTRL